MKEKENTVPTGKKKKIVYSMILAACVLLLVAATVLTAYFVGGEKEVADVPPVVDPTVDDPVTPPPDDPVTPPPGESDLPSEPSGGEVRVAFIAPLSEAAESVEYYEIYKNETLDHWTRHLAIDYAATEGTEVRAMGDGKVVTVSLSPELGNLVVIEHEGGLRTLYRFVEPVETLKENDAVKQGDVIGKIASAYGTESKDGTHLHLEMSLNGTPVDPKNYIGIAEEK